MDIKQFTFNKKILAHFCLISLMFLPLVCQAIKFTYDNYSSAPKLKCSFTYNGYDWLNSGDDNSPFLSPRKFKTIEFDSTIPLAWKIEPPTDKKIYCWDFFDKQKKEVKNIVTLSRQEFSEKDDLLLDIIDNGKNSILISIIDTNGDRLYSNAIACSIVSY